MKKRLLVLLLAISLSINSLLIVHAESGIAEVTQNGETTTYYDLNSLKVKLVTLFMQEFTVKLLSDIRLDSRFPIPVDSKVTLDLNGFSLNRGEMNEDYDTDSDCEVIFVPYASTLTIIDSNPEREHYGTIRNPDDSDYTMFKSWFENGTVGTPYPVKGGIITGGSNDSGGGGITIGESATVIMKGGNIIGNVSNKGGGGVQLQGEGSRFVLDGGKILFNGAWRDSGGGIKAENGTVEIISGDICYNWADEYSSSYGDGGGIYINYETNRTLYIHGTNTSSDGVERRSVNISYNYAESEGGGIYLNNGESTIMNAAIEYNICSGGDGGGITIEDDGSSSALTTVTGSLINGNRASDDGGGICINNEGYIQIANSIITNNVAGDEGGGIYFDAYGDSCNILDLTVTGNSANKNGGGIYLEDTIHIGGTMIVKNNNSNDGKHNLYKWTGTSNHELTLSDLSSNSELYFYCELDDGSIITTKPTKSSAKGIFGDGNYHFEKISDPTNPNYRHIVKVAGPATPQIVESVEVWDVVNKDTDADASNLGCTMSIDESKGTVNNFPVYKGYLRFADALETGEDKNFTMNYYYSDGLFFTNPEEYNKHLASLSASLSMASGASSQGITTINDPSTQKNRFNYLTQTFSDIGCTNESMYVNDYYMKKPDVDTMGVAMANKVIYKNNQESEENKYLLIPIFVRSYNYGKEWVSNFTLGDGTENNGEAKGFSSSADIVMKDLAKYISDHPEVQEAINNGRAIFWLGGYSRGGAVTNICAKRITDLYAYGEAGTSKGNTIFAYCISAAQGGVETLDKSGGYLNIHNIINKSDFVTYVAPNEMGFKRYGVDHYLPGDDAQSVTSDKIEITPNNELTIYRDNNYSEIDYYDNQYMTLRNKFIKQLEVTLPTVEFDDYFHAGEINYFWGNDYTSWIPIFGKEMITEADYSPLSTKMKFNQELWARMLRYSANSGNAGHDWVTNRNDTFDYREFYANNKNGHFMPNSKYYNSGSATLEETFRTLLEIAMGGEKELDLNNLFDVTGALTDVALDIYDEVIGDLYDTNMTPERYTYWIDKIWEILTQDLDDTQQAKGYKNLKDILGDDLEKAKNVYPTLLAMVLDLVNDDYNDTEQGQFLLGTLAYNMDNMINEHLVNAAWIRADDDWYANDQTRYKMVINTSKPDAPIARLSPISEDEEEIVVKENENTNAVGSQKLYLRAQPGAAIYYTLTIDDEELVSDKLYQGVHGIDLPVGKTVVIKTYDKAYEQKSNEATYIIDVTTNCIVNDEEGNTISPKEPLDKDGAEPKVGDRFVDTNDKQYEIIEVTLDSETGSYLVTASEVFSVSFDLNGGSLEEGSEELPTSVVKNKTIEKPDVEPVKEGHEFIGWYLNDEEYDFSKPVTQELNLIAKYQESEEITKYTITYQLDGGLYNESSDDIIEEYDENSVIKLHEAPIKEGYTFLYWDNEKYLPSVDYTVTENHTFKAIWQENSDTDPEWNNPTYSWADDNSSVTAKRVSKNDETLFEEETINTTSEVTTNPTCLEKGKTTYTATFTNEAFETQSKTVENIDPIGHDYGKWTTVVEPTCEDKGKEERICSHDATHKEEKEIAALGHSYGAWSVTRKPTTTQEGEESRTCSRCNKVETRSIPKLDILYYNTAGNGNVWIKGSNDTSTFTFKRVSDDELTHKNFTGILVDNKSVDSSNYDFIKGSVVIKLKPAYLETLSVGTHTLTALFSDGDGVTVNFEVKEKAKSIPRPIVPNTAAK